MIKLKFIGSFLVNIAKSGLIFVDVLDVVRIQFIEPLISPNA
jgi:hypothetical protein